MHVLRVPFCTIAIGSTLAFKVVFLNARIATFFVPYYTMNKFT
jgi:hypothetical protein